MMQFLYDGSFYKAVKISGPKHNLLSLSLGVNCKAPEVVELSSKEKGSQKLDRDEVLSQVVFGLEQVNKELGTNYVVETIQYVPSDSPSKQVYIELTQSIIKKIHEGGIFRLC